MKHLAIIIIGGLLGFGYLMVDFWSNATLQDFLDLPIWMQALCLLIVVTGVLHACGIEITKNGFERWED